MKRWTEAELRSVQESAPEGLNRPVARSIRKDVELSVEAKFDATRPEMRGRPRSKFGNVKTEGFDSKREAKRAKELRWLLAAGLIQDLRTQVRYELIPAQQGERACAYVADFVYVEGGKEVVEDCKGVRTDVYRIKRKLMLHVHGIRLLET